MPKEVAAVANLPCHDGRGCDAPCCIAPVSWDIVSYNNLIKQFPGILARKRATSILIAGYRNYFVIIPEGFGVSNLPMGFGEFDPLARMWMAEGKRCVFLGSDSRCEVYDFRPHVCRNFGVSEGMLCPKGEYSRIAV